MTLKKPFYVWLCIRLWCLLSFCFFSFLIRQFSLLFGILMFYMVWWIYLSWLAHYLFQGPFCVPPHKSEAGKLNALFLKLPCIEFWIWFRLHQSELVWCLSSVWAKAVAYEIPILLLGLGSGGCCSDNFLIHRLCWNDAMTSWMWQRKQSSG